jgi:hypothetical protein
VTNRTIPQQNVGSNKISGAHLSPGFAGCQVPVNPSQRTGESSPRRRTVLLKKNPPLATGPSLGRNGNVSRFAAALCVVIHTRRGNSTRPSRWPSVFETATEKRLILLAKHCWRGPWLRWCRHHGKDAIRTDRYLVAERRFQDRYESVSSADLTAGRQKSPPGTRR